MNEEENYISNLSFWPNFYVSLHLCILNIFRDCKWMQFVLLPSTKNWEVSCLSQMSCLSNKWSSMCFKEWMTFINKSLKKFCNPRMAWTIWSSVPLNKSGALVNHYQIIIVTARTNIIMNRVHQWEWCSTDQSKWIDTWFSFHNTNLDVGT